MTRSELIDKVAADAEITKKQAAAAIDSLIDGIAEGLKTDDRVTLTGFGTFTAKNRAARMARNPRTGEEVPVPARRVPGFKPGAKLKDAVAA
jgi:DNA-binding protein HU-beta